ncbi:tyrosine-protein phosphatase [Lactiplantibacillus garii]|uniref:Tyrosine-protein phosphatase n=1 Tax=Lactiplantibacillus garii TaxID=2306423 RepID=A0A3R8KK97_9LACO|nr:tyrosine-protein phosphatase [Lactiplantibacillus garii]RRK09692.1 tyrosine-protein phosphatase [Lactiplantibacillus garii]
MQPITNFRTLGGYHNLAGQTVKHGWLYRSGQLDKLDPDQLQYLTHDLKIKRIVDMRTAEERQRFPDVPVPHADYTVLDILEQTGGAGASLQSMIVGNGNVHDRMLELYEQLALSSSARAGYHQFITGLLNPVPVVFHCFAGKDRTGVGAALILKILNVSNEQIMGDYLQTNLRRADANQTILTALTGKVSTDQLAAIDTALKVDRDYLQRYFDVINQRYGTFENYLHAGLNLTASELTQIRRLYLETA